ncbi:folate-binding protein YgfZ [Oceanobacter sp. 3_MG-2023]|uniref:CAF17-like 4Fe-4S cluster assembly/insertion protein YgfZ n=1 Tax=Oceanobacter sp. 3_MG-2023 TaxID=3062622 RepID=UPI00273514A7|nr:hypothetical protein [Oceanobacter sp. 3_MG-2023]MDP2506811.1 hypothetical protein [Oceanobacter sp. 3_MG-2023]
MNTISTTPIATDNRLSDFSLLEVTGPDAARLLQGQLTCDVTGLADGQWTLGACCNAKGRMVTNFMLAHTDDRFIFRLATDVTELFQRHLSKYAVFYKVSLTPLSTAIFGYQTSVPAAVSERTLQKQHDALLLNWPDGRIECWADTAPTTPDSTPLAQAEWQQQDIQAGLVWVTQKSVEHWIPQHIAWDKLDGVNFKKGCYTGQEVVARVQYLGKAKKQLVKATCADEATPDLLSPVKTSIKAVGEVASWHGTGGLLVLNGEPEEPLTLDDGTPITVTPLPFAISPATAE